MRDYKAEQSASATSVQEPVLGERWYILRKGATTCSTVIIELVTPAVIGVKTDAWGAIEVIPRYYLTLVERVASAPATVPTPTNKPTFTYQWTANGKDVGESSKVPTKFPPAQGEKP